MVNPNPIFSAYWCGGCHEKNKINRLDTIPDYIQNVSLFCAGLNKDSTMTTEFLCKYWNVKEIKGWVEQLKERGQQFRMTVLDSDAVHWDQVDPEKYAQSAVEVVLGEWKLGGFDFDVEGPSIASLKQVIPAIRKAAGPEPTITFTCYTGSEEELDILRSVKGSIDWLQTMAYFDDFEQMKQLAETYAEIVGKENVVIGVKNGTDSQTTPLPEVLKLVRWVKKNGYKGIMLWATDRDNPNFGDKKKWEWAEAIHTALDEKSVIATWVEPEDSLTFYLSILTDVIMGASKWILDGAI